jgi:hypothetical protein
MDQYRQTPVTREQGTYSQTDRSDERNGARAGFLTRLFNVGPSAGERKADSAWGSVFAQPLQPKPDREPSDSMDRFRALMVSSSPPDKTATPAASSPALPRNPYLQQQPAFNPAGSSATALQDNLNRPTGIQPLPGAVTKPAPPTVTRPTWQAQLPPWLSDKPQQHDTHSF